MEKRYFLTRHSIKPKGEDVESEEYKGISKKGVELARNSAKNILDDIERTPKGAVIFLGGASDEIRTRSTAEVYGDELKRLLADKEDYMVITRGDITKGKGYSAMAKQVKEMVDANPDKRIIVDIPMFMKEFSLKRKGWLTKEGKPAPYLTKLIERHKGNEYEAMKDWLTTQGKEGELRGPAPEDIAKSYEKGINRLEKFAKRYIGDRPYVTGLVGHSFEADAYLTYLAGDGKVDLSTFEKVSSGKGMIKETEMASVRVTPEITTITYRGAEHHKRKGLENIAGALAIMGVLGGIFFLSPNLTGNAIADLTNKTTSFVGAGLLIVGLVGAFFYFKNRNIVKRK